MTDTEIEARLNSIERRLALYDLIASYGPAVDSGSAETTGSLFAEDGVYDFGNAVLDGRQAIADMVRGRQHQGLIHAGAAHALGMPRITIEGDRAVAIGYSQVFRADGDRFYVWRVSANRWDLTWRDGHWEVDSRKAYPLTGDEAARALLGRAV